MTPSAKEPGSQQPSRRATERTSRRATDIDGIELFDGLVPAARSVLLAKGVLRRFAPDEVMWRSGAEATAMHVILAGEVRVVRSGGGRQRVMHTEKRGGTLADVALFSGQGFPATAIAVTPVTTIALTLDVLHGLIAGDPSFAFRLLARLAGRVRHVIGLIDRITAWSVQARLARFLIERRQATGRDVFALGMTHQQLAEELGTVREVVVRALGDLRDRGHIETAGRGRYRICEPTALAGLAQPASP